MTKLKLILLLFFIGLVVLVIRCREPFEASVSSSKIRILIVDGYINAGPGQTVIRLSRATPLGESQSMDYERNATVSIVDSENQEYILTESSDGMYTSGELNLPIENEYKLKIVVEGAEEYHSTSLPVKVTPPIDSISWEWTKSLDIYANAHDAESKTHYYMWTYQEDWEIRSAYKSLLMWDDTVKPRPPPETNQMFICWKSAKSKGLIFESTSSLTSDKMKFLLKQIAHAAERTSWKYAITVTQHTLDEPEYDYLKLMEKNTQQVGSFFDPMPSQLYGNIENIKQPDETVIGYVGVYTTVTKRLFILNSELPSSPRGSSCPTRSIEQLNKDSVAKYVESGLYIPTGTFLKGLESTPWMTIMVTPCLDCRVYGTTVRPDFW